MKKLIDDNFKIWLQFNKATHWSIMEQLMNEYQESINEALDESENVTDNEDEKENYKPILKHCRNCAGYNAPCAISCEVCGIVI